MLDAEPLFLVNDDKAQFPEFHIAGEQPVGAHPDVHGAIFEAPQCLLLFLGAAVAGQQPDADGVRPHAGQRRVEMLPRQNGGGGQNGALFAAHHAFEGGAQRHLGLAHAHIAAEQPIHGPLVFHVGFDLVGGGELVGGLLIGKALLKISLPGVIRREGIALGLTAAGVQFNEFFGHLFGGRLDPFAGAGPVRAAQLVQLDLVAVAGGGVTGEQVQLGDRNVQHILAGVLDAQAVFGDALHRDALDARVPTDAVVLVDHQIAGGQLAQAGIGVLSLFATLDHAAFPVGAGGDERETGKGDAASGGEMPRQHLHLAFLAG